MGAKGPEIDTFLKTAEKRVDNPVGFLYNILQ